MEPDARRRLRIQLMNEDFLLPESLEPPIYIGDYCFFPASSEANLTPSIDVSQDNGRLEGAINRFILRNPAPKE